jgi:hypothetical protein
MFKILNIFATYKIFKNALLQPIGTIGNQFLQKNEKRIFHACVPVTLFYTRGLGIVVLHVMVPEPYRFPLCYLIQMWEGNAAIQSRGRAAYSGGWGSLMTHTAGSVTMQSIAFKCVMAFEPYKNT